MNANNKALSAYEPPRAPGAEPTLALPLQVYIIETIERDERRKVLRQLSIVATLVIGLFVSQWPVAFSAANAVPTVQVSTQAKGFAAPSPVMVERLTFAPSLGPAAP